MAQEIRHPEPVPDWETRAYWEGCGRHELVLQRCGSCGAIQHRPRALCVSCLSDDLEYYIASGSGTVFTFTVTEQNQVPGFREACPYVLAYVELDEGPRILTNLVGCEPGQIRIGMPVTVDYFDIEGQIGIPRFRPA